MWSFLRKCLEDCTSGHGKCKAAQEPSFHPERLLRLTRDGDGNVVLQLVQTKNHTPGSPYIALSHCWGSSSPFCTTKGNFLELLEKIQLSELPRTFQDCVTTARELGVEYIWIDSLCIIQDDRGDWSRHAQCMDKIYENALFTVAAVSSPSGQVPFLGTEAPTDREKWQAVDIDIGTKSTEPQSVTSTLQPKVKARRCDPYLYPAFFFGPLEYRGWAWQERYLSVRIINFTKEEVRWHCKTCETCECIGRMTNKDSEVYPEQPSRESDETQTMIWQWRDVVGKYSQRYLTYDSDRLPALSGVASRFHTKLQSEYLAGIWLADFPHNLAWYRREMSDSPNGKDTLWRSLVNDVPSWSWASVYQEMYWMWDINLQNFNFEGPLVRDIAIESRIELISWSCRPSADNIFGDVEAGSYIELRGLVVEAEMESDCHGCACVRRKGFGPQHVVQDCNIVLESAPEGIRKLIPSRLRPKSSKNLRRAILDEGLSNEERSIGSVCCLLVFTSAQNGKNHACVLILGEQSHGTYQRLGIGNGDTGWSRPLYKQRKDWDNWKDWEDLEEWDAWEEWFADGNIRTLKVI